MMATPGQRNNRGCYKRYPTRPTTSTGGTESRDNASDGLSSKLNEVRISQRQESAAQRSGHTASLAPVRSARGSKRRSGTPNCPKPDESVQTGLSAGGRRRRRGRGRGSGRQVARDGTLEKPDASIPELTQVNLTNSRPCDELPTLDSWDGPPFAFESYHYQVQGTGDDTHSTLGSVRQEGHEPTSELDREGSFQELSSSLASGRNTTLSDSDDNDGFIERLSEDYLCPICLSVLQDAILTSCCGNHFCKQCIERVKDTGQPCPLCKEQQYEIMRDKFFIRKLNEHKVKCPNRSQGCKWVGELGDQKEHVRFCSYQSACGEVTSGHQVVCDSNYVPCPNKCGATRIGRMKLQTHLTKRCPRLRRTTRALPRQEPRERDVQTHPNENEIGITLTSPLQQPRELDVQTHPNENESWITDASPLRQPRERDVPNESWITDASPPRQPRERDVPNESWITDASPLQQPRQRDDSDDEPYFSSWPSSYAREYQHVLRIDDSGRYSSEIVKLLLDIASLNPEIRVSRVTNSEAVAGATGAVASGALVGGRLGYITGLRGMLSGAVLGAAVGGYMYMFAESVLESDQSAVDALKRLIPKALAATALSVAQQLGLSMYYVHGCVLLRSSSWLDLTYELRLRFLIAVLKKLDYRVVNVA